MAGAVRHDRNPVGAAEVLRIQTHRVRDASAVDTERGAVDMVQGVCLLVIVGIERLVGGAAPELGLLGGLLDLSAGEQATLRDTRQREAVVVGPTVERGVLRGLAGHLQIGDERALDTGRAFGHHRLTAGV